MKLVLMKSQQKGFTGKISFEVKASVRMSEEENRLISHYKLDNMVLLSKKLINIWGQVTENEINVSVRDMLNGESYKCKNLSEVISYSDSLVEACKTMKTYLDVARKFGGEEVIDIDKLFNEVETMNKKLIL